MAFPSQRLRRLRQNQQLRSLVREHELSISKLILPLFVVPGQGIRLEIASLPGNYHLSIDRLIEEALTARDLGIPAVLLFGIPESRDEEGSGAYAPHGIVQEAVRALKMNVPDLVVMTDVCACEYVTSGHCGFIKGGYLDNDSSLELVTKIALSHAEAGSDMVAPASMLDGQIHAIREALDGAGFHNLPIMAYAAKFASGLYDPFFKEGTKSTVAFGDKKTHQMDFSNSDEAMREIELDIEEGADIIMVKPALFYLDIVARAKREFHMPLAVYGVSGEYAMIDAAARLGRVNRDAIMIEALTAMKRAGADLIITYFAMRAAEVLANHERWTAGSVDRSRLEALVANG
ncbi:MAG TPA: porphobilinogen synthase [Acidobacteriaceae bacterium]|nr:porphobilinogen synthase [Acidobacteriaceae bacterium]